MEAKTTSGSADSDILFSRTVKAGQRIYYVDVKENRRKELYLSITESKKLTTGTADNVRVSYEKHKIFVFPEDFQKFVDSVQEAISFVQSGNDEAGQGIEPGEIHIDMELPTDL